MATYQADGTTAVTPTSTRNNRGVIRHGGTLATTKFISKPIAETVPRASNLVNDGEDIDTPKVGGAYNAQRAGEYVMMKVTNKIAGVTDTTLRSGAADFGHRRPINYVESIRTSFLSNWGWASTAEGNLVYSGTVTTTDNSYGTDNAAHPSSAIPGSLIYRTGSPLVTETNYSRRTNN